MKMNIKELQTSVEQLAMKMFPKSFNRATSHYFLSYINTAFNEYTGSISDCCKQKTLYSIQNDCYRITKNILVPDNKKMPRFKKELSILFLKFIDQQ